MQLHSSHDDASALHFFSERAVRSLGVKTTAQPPPGLIDGRFNSLEIRVLRISVGNRPQRRLTIFSQQLYIEKD